MIQFRNILVATEDRNVIEEVRSCLEEIDLECRKNPAQYVKYGDSAIAQFRERKCDLVVVDQDLSWNANHPKPDDSETARSLIDKISKEGTEVSILYVVRELIREEVSDIQKIMGARLIVIEEDLNEVMKATLEELRMLRETGNNQDEDPRPLVTIEFDFSNPGEQTCSFKYHRPPLNKIIGQPVALDKEKDKVDRFVRSCDRFEKQVLDNRDAEGSREWLETLNDLAGDAHDIIFANETARTKIFEAFDICKDHREVKIRFNLSSDQHPGMFEVARLRKDDYPLMVKAPTARRINFDQCGQSELVWSDDDPIDILVIESVLDEGSLYTDTCEPTHLAATPHAAAEVKMLAELGEILKNKSRPVMWTPDEDRWRPSAIHVDIGKVDVLPAYTEDNVSLAMRIEEALRDSSNQYDIVHYAGHSICETEDQTFESSRLVVPAKEKGMADKITMREFATWLGCSRTQFVFMNSCNSAIGGNSRSAVAHALAAKQIPALLGFLWKIDDLDAAAFAAAFYRFLFCDTCSLDEALVEARRGVHDKTGEDSPIWAAPILVLQPENWNRRLRKSSWSSQ